MGRFLIIVSSILAVAACHSPNKGSTRLNYYENLRSRTFFAEQGDAYDAASAAAEGLDYEIVAGNRDRGMLVAYTRPTTAATAAEEQPVRRIEVSLEKVGKSTELVRVMVDALHVPSGNSQPEEGARVEDAQLYDDFYHAFRAALIHRPISTEGR